MLLYLPSGNIIYRHKDLITNHIFTSATLA